MALTLTDVSRIAHLARLELSSADEALMLEQLNGFFGIVEQMRAVDTRGVEPLYTPLSAVHAAALRLREDVVTEGDLFDDKTKVQMVFVDGVKYLPVPEAAPGAGAAGAMGRRPTDIEEDENR